MKCVVDVFNYIKTEYKSVFCGHGHPLEIIASQTRCRRSEVMLTRSYMAGLLIKVACTICTYGHKYTCKNPKFLSALQCLKRVRWAKSMRKNANHKVCGLLRDTCDNWDFRSVVPIFNFGSSISFASHLWHPPPWVRCHMWKSLYIIYYQRCSPYGQAHGTTWIRTKELMCES